MKGIRIVVRRVLGFCACFMVFSLHGQSPTCRPFLSYAFALQKIDYMHQLAVGCQREHWIFELQQGLGQRNASAGNWFTQTGVNLAWTKGGGWISAGPWFRYSAGRLGRPFAYTYHRIEAGGMLIFQCTRQRKNPLDMLCYGGVGKAFESRGKGNIIGFLDYSFNIGLRYAWR